MEILILNKNYFLLSELNLIRFENFYFDENILVAKCEF